MELNQERFEAWLFSQPKNRVIEAANGNKCFLCSFVKETTNLRYAFMSGWFAWYSDARYSNKYQPLPQWATQLIDRKWVLNNFPDNGPDCSCPITVAQMQTRYLKLFPQCAIVAEEQSAMPQ